MTAVAARSPVSGGKPLADVPVLIVNPRSGNGSTGRSWNELQSDATEAFGEIAVRVTERSMDAARLTTEALEAGHRTVLAVGGDGTLNEVVNGFFREDGSLVAQDAAVGILPCGSGSDFRRSVHVPVKWKDACRHVAAAPVRRVDVGQVSYLDHDGNFATRRFINIGSVGVSGEVIKATESVGKGFGGHLAYKLATLRALRRYRDATVDMSVDGALPERVRVTVLAMANGAFFGGGMHVAPGASLDDGEFSCTLWAGFRVRDFIFGERKIYSGAHTEWSRTRCFPARSVRLESAERVLLEVDGEFVGTLPASFEILPSAIGLKA